MNYGKFFRLNKHLSRIEDGFAIYDYIDLPAYFTPSKDNLMSPKYPISVMIMGDSVVFMLHYSAYKIEEVSKREAQDESIKGYSNYPQYIYNIEAPSLISENKVKGGDTTKIVHMEEIILELPFTDTVGRSLSDTIRDIYDTQFPLVQRDNGKDSDLSSKEKSSGGRYLEKLIRTRYLEEKVDEVRDVNSHFYESLRKISDGTASYSTLWLMGLVKGDKNDVRYRRTDKKGNVIGFLRKLLLDFMFDLKHSDVFQNSSNYLQMYSGLMSNFYFSALMHKCEYYYYRDLITAQIKNGNLTKKDKERLQCLYATNLCKAEELWTQDIMSAKAERYFEYETIDTKSKEKYKWYDKCCMFLHLLEDNQLINRGSWFAEPEEEMRRVCFPMDKRDEEGNLIEKQICNVETFNIFIDINSDENAYQKELSSFAARNKEFISRWFLKRYDFNDVCHLHLSRFANAATFSPIFFFILLFVTLNSLSETLIKTIDKLPWLPTLILVLFFAIIACYFQCKGDKYKRMKDSLINKHIKKNCRRITTFMIIISCVVLVINYGWFFLILLGLVIIYKICMRSTKTIGNSLEHITSYLHLLFPRLVASITTAWLTMSMGFDLYVSFFDKHVSWPTAFMILIIVFIFVMYELNRITPRSNVWKKLTRCLQLVTISYAISLVVGFVVIDFVGERFMGKSGNYDDNEKIEIRHDRNTCITEVAKNGEMTSKELKELMQKDHCAEGCKSIQIFNLGGHNVFFMRDYLIMFSFVTMFMGIFLQMFIFEEKKMTEL